MKKAIGAGIGLFIAFIGFQNAGIIVNNDATLVGLGDICHGKALVGIIGLAITAGLVMAKVRGGMLIGILATAIIGIFIKDPATGAAITTLPSKVISLPDSVAPIFCQFEWNHILSWDMLAVVFTFLFIDMFDTMGTIIMMPLAYSISDGILIGVISYVICHAISGQFKKINPTMWVLAVLFVLKYIFI